MKYLAALPLCLLCACAYGGGPTTTIETTSQKDASVKDASPEVSVADVSVPDLGTDPDTKDAALTPCVSGNWFVRFVPWTCPLCVFCPLYHIPPFYTANVTETLQVMNCTAKLVSVENPHRCAYQADETCVPTLVVGNDLESFQWAGTYGSPALNEVVFQRFTGELPVGVANGQVLSEYFYEQEIGLGGLMIGLDAGAPCGVRILLTKEEE